MSKEDFMEMFALTQSLPGDFCCQYIHIRRLQAA